MSKPNTDKARFSVAAQGVPGIANEFNKFEMNSSAKYPIGFKVEDASGNVYRYAHFQADTNRGVLVSANLDETGLDDTDNKVTGTPTNSGDNALGSKYIEMNVSAVASVLANDYAGGRVVITDDTGEGYTYDVLGNTAKGTPAADLVRIQLKQPIQVSLSSTTDLAVIASRYANLTIATATDTAVSGVSCSTIAVATAMYGWIQTKGDIGVLQDGVVAVGQPVQLSDGTSGAVQMFGGAATASAVVATDLVLEPIIGFCVMSGDTTGHGIFHIDLE